MSKIILPLSLTVVVTIMVGALHAQSSLDAYITQSQLNSFTEIVNSGDGLVSPVDLDFHRDFTNRPNELWVLNQGTYNSGGSTVIVEDVTATNLVTDYRQDGNAWHFMAMASALAMGADNTWATSQDILDANRSGGKFTGPTLWSSDMAIYAIVGNPPTAQFNGSHLDMVHQSPYGKGIAWERDNIYWIYDGYSNDIVRYDFAHDHGPGQHDHTDAIVRRYTEVQVGDISGVANHMEIDHNTQMLYLCDAANGHIIRLDITSGSFSKNLPEINFEGLAENSEYTGAIFDTVITGLAQPVGIDIYGNRMVITDNGTDEIILYDLIKMKEVGRIPLTYTGSPDIRGIKVGYDSKIYFVDYTMKKLYRLDNSAVNPVGIGSTRENETPAVWPNPLANGMQLHVFSPTESMTGLLTDLQGKVIKTMAFDKGENTVPLDRISSGMYILSMQSANRKESMTFKIVVH